jgi:hypothetical protein
MIVRIGCGAKENICHALFMNNVLNSWVRVLLEKLTPLS